MKPTQPQPSHPSAAESAKGPNPTTPQAAQATDPQKTHVDPHKGPSTDASVPKDRQNDRAAGNQSGLGSNPSARDMTSGRHSGNQ